MQTIRHCLALFFALIASLGFARAEEKPPLQEPQLRIEAGMHTTVLNRIDVDRDGKLLVTGSDDKTVRLWSLPDGKLLETFRVPMGPGNDGKVFAVALSPDGRLIAAGGWDAYRGQNGGSKHFVYLFDTVSGALQRRLGPLPNVILDLAFSPDGERLAAGLASDAGIRLWSSPFTGNPVSDANYEGSVYGVDFDSSGSGRLATTCEDGAIRLYERDMVAPPKQFKAPGGEPYDIDFSPDGETLAIGYADSVKVDLISAPDLARVQEVDTAFAEKGNLGRVAWSADGRSLFAGGKYDDGTGVNPVIRWPDAGRGKPEPLGGPLNTVLDLAALRNGGVVFGSADPAFGIFGAGDQSPLYRGSVIADMRSKKRGNFGISPIARGVWFGLEAGSTLPWHFDVDRLDFVEMRDRPADYLAPVTDTLQILNWENALKPTLGNLELPLDAYENSRSLAVAPDAQSFILGTDWSIYRFDSTGNQTWRNYIEGTAWGVNLSADGSVIVAAHGDGTIRWYRASDGALLLTFFVHVPDKRWIAWTPTGYYAASSGGEDLIGWHVNGKTWDAPVDFFPASLFREKFYRPDIVQLVLKTKDEAKAVAEANEIAKRKEEESKLPAVVEILADPRGVETDKPDLALKYRLRSPSARAITRLEVKIDGRPIDSKGIETFEEELALDTENIITVGIPPQDSVVSLIAYIGDQPSEAASIAVKWTGKRPEDKPKPKLTALLVGISGYSIPNMAPLEYADDDAADLEDLLKKQEGPMFSKVKTLKIANKAATRAEIKRGLIWLDENTEAGDYALLLLSGHGLTDKRQKFYFLPIDADTSPGMLGVTSVSEAEIKDILSTIRGSVIFLLDACRSGAGIEGFSHADAAGLINGLSRSDVGIVSFASSDGNQDSLESSAWKNGAFTEGLLAGLKGEANYERDGAVDTGELQLFLPRYVSKLTKDRQLPIYRKPDLNKDFALTAAGP